MEDPQLDLNPVVKQLDLNPVVKEFSEFAEVNRCIDMFDIGKLIDNMEFSVWDTQQLIFSGMREGCNLNPNKIIPR